MPDYWDDQPKDATGKEETVHLVQLDRRQNRVEYNKVQSHFKLTGSDGRIMTIKRVQNPGLYGMYAVNRKKMDERKGSNEKWLFHATAEKNVKGINTKGFNRSFAGANGTNIYFLYTLPCSASPPTRHFLCFYYFFFLLSLFFFLLFVISQHLSQLPSAQLLYYVPEALCCNAFVKLSKL